MRRIKISCRQIYRAAQRAILRKVKGVRQSRVAELDRQAIGLLKVGELGVVRKPNVVKSCLFAESNIIEIDRLAKNGVGEADIVAEGSVGEYRCILERVVRKVRGIAKTGILKASLWSRAGRIGVITEITGRQIDGWLLLPAGGQGDPCQQ